MSDDNLVNLENLSDVTTSPIFKKKYSMIGLNEPVEQLPIIKKETNNINLNNDTKFNLKKNICNLVDCERKLSLVESTIKCRCQNTFCTKHRLPKAHNCTYDYKLDHKRQLEENLVKVIADKIQKI